MGNEIEAKFKITEAQALSLESQLKKHFEYERLEINEFYDTKKRKLDGRDEVLRIRITQSPTEGDKSMVTFKGKPVKSRFKSRPEFETVIENDEAMRLIFQSLGYTKYFSFEKRRKNYDFGGCSVEIDLLPELGYFCEIEGVDERMIESVRVKLGLTNLKPIKDGYGMLLWKHAKKNRIERASVTF